MDLIANIMQTPSINEFTSSKMPDAAVMKLYASYNPTIRNFSHQFYLITLTNHFFKKNRVHS
jgi:hypothetical protein